MGLATFKPFGRGSASSATAIDTIYDTLRTLSNTNLDWENFHPQAEISETYIAWARHNHDDGTLGPAVIGSEHLKYAAGSADQARVIHTQGGKVLMLWGALPMNSVTWSPNENIEVEFAATSVSKQAFAPGTIPTVLSTMSTGEGVSTGYIAYSYWPISVTSQGFTLSGIDLHDGLSGDFDIKDLTIYYLATGRAPGYLPPLERI